MNDVEIVKKAMSILGKKKSKKKTLAAKRNIMKRWAKKNVLRNNI